MSAFEQSVAPESSPGVVYSRQTDRVWRLPCYSPCWLPQTTDPRFLLTQRKIGMPYGGVHFLLKPHGRLLTIRGRGLDKGIPALRIGIIFTTMQMCEHARTEILARRDGVDYVRCLDCDQVFEAEDLESVPVYDEDDQPAA